MIILVIGGWSFSYEIAFMWMSLELTNDKSIWLGAVRQQAITWANDDPALCRHMVSLGHNGLKRGNIILKRSNLDKYGDHMRNNTE